MSIHKILFVCMGNICRSPTAEGAFRQLVAQQHLQAQFHIDSAGTHSYHIDDAPDLRAQRAALDRGIDISGLRARAVLSGDFSEFDLLLVMDDENYAHLMQRCPAEFQHKVRYLLEFAPAYKDKQVPDPYYGGSYGFERVLDMTQASAAGLLLHFFPHIHLG